MLWFDNIISNATNYQNWIKHYQMFKLKNLLICELLFSLAFIYNKLKNIF